MSGPDLLVLARHATPLVDPDLPASAWPLSEVGEADARRLGERWRPLGIDVVVSSVERKARQTASSAAEVLGMTAVTADGLHEHERPYFEVRDRFEQFMDDFFADAAAREVVERRFSTGLDAVATMHGGARLAVVAHGTVMSLHLAARYALDAKRIWSQLGMPSYVVLEPRTRTVVDLIVEV